jgi:hypothetical protein
MQIDVDDSFVDKLIVEDLKKSYISCQEEVARLAKKTEPLENYEYQDIYDSEEVSNAIARVLQYYMYRPDADAFISKNRFRQGHFFD